MMRSLYSAVSGLKTHQTKMDVIGNNISNVNTVAFKSSSVVFNSIMYQTLSSASGANDSTGVGGVNAKQIGLGVNTGSTTMSITSAGAAETTGNPFDLKITDKSTSSFFIVDSGAEKLFTKAGSFYVDGTGNLCMTSTGYTVQGWQVDPTTGQIRKDTVSSLKIMSPENQTSSPEATTKAVCSGVVDNNSVTMNTDQGYSMNLLIYDDLGYQYTAKFAVQAVDTKNGKYAVNLTDIMANKADGSTESILNQKVNLSQLFGSSTYQGSVVDITSNYKATGSAASDLKKIVNAKAVAAGKENSTPPATTGATGNGPLYSYYWDAEDINNYLGITGSSKKVPDGYKLSYPPTDAAGKIISGSKTLSTPAEIRTYLETAKSTLDILDAGGKKIGTATRDTTVAGGWKLTDTSTPAKDITDFNLYNTVSIDDFLSDGTLVSEVTPSASCYRFKGDQIDALAEHLHTTRAALGVTDTTMELYYFPDAVGSEKYTVNSIPNFDVNANGKFMRYKPAATTGGTPEIKAANSAGEKPNPETYTYAFSFQEEEMLSTYTYSSVKGSDLNEDDPIFTENLPADAEIKYYNFLDSFKITTPTADGFLLQFDTAKGTLENIGGGTATTQMLNLSQLSNCGYDGFSDVEIDFSGLLNYNNSGSSTAAMDGGDRDGFGKGKKLGNLTGLTVDTSGKIYGSYNNGNTVLIGQIAVAQFSNAAGLEATGDNCFRTTLNSGDFDGIGVEISADGSSITTGQLEMSNVDLSTEFTTMISTQRGFQANSRVITTTDSMLEELINLKR